MGASKLGGGLLLVKPLLLPYTSSF